MGGTYIKTQTGVNVTGGNNLNTDNNYTVTWNGSATTGSFVIANKTDIRRTTTISLNLADPAITASNLSVKAANSGNTNISVTSPEGVTAAVLNNNWNGGGQWFDISTNQTTGSGAKNIVITQRNNINTVMKAVTIRLTNNITGGAYKDIMVTPTNFTSPTLSATSYTDNDYYLNKDAITFTGSASGGSDATTSDAAVATVSRNGNTYTVIPKGIGSCTITVSNTSDSNKKSTYSVTIGGKNYNGKLVWKYYGYYIAPENAGQSTWNTSLTATFCQGQTGATWIVPGRQDHLTILQTTGLNRAPENVFNEYKSKNVFNSGYHWASETYGGGTACFMNFSSSYASTGSGLGKGNTAYIRCVAKE